MGPAGRLISGLASWEAFLSQPSRPGEYGGVATTTTATVLVVLVPIQRKVEFERGVVLQFGNVHGMPNSCEAGTS